MKGISQTKLFEQIFREYTHRAAFCFFFSFLFSSMFSIFVVRKLEMEDIADLDTDDIVL